METKKGPHKIHRLRERRRNSPRSCGAGGIGVGVGDLPIAGGVGGHWGWSWRRSPHSRWGGGIGVGVGGDLPIAGVVEVLGLERTPPKSVGLWVSGLEDFSDPKLWGCGYLGWKNPKPRGCWHYGRRTSPPHRRCGVSSGAVSSGAGSGADGALTSMTKRLSWLPPVSEMSSYLSPRRFSFSSITGFLPCLVRIGPCCFTFCSTRTPRQTRTPKPR